MSRDNATKKTKSLSSNKCIMLWVVELKSVEMLVVEGRGKPECLEKNLSEQGREPTTNSTHI